METYWKDMNQSLSLLTVLVSLDLPVFYKMVTSVSLSVHHCGLPSTRKAHFCTCLTTQLRWGGGTDPAPREPALDFLTLFPLEAKYTGYNLSHLKEVTTVMCWFLTYYLFTYYWKQGQT